MKKLTRIITGTFISIILLLSPKLNAQNVTLGPGAGASITVGFQNTLIGEDAGNSITNSIDNTFLGFEAGLNNIVNGNTFLGVRAGKENTTGLYNTFVGINAGKNNTEGYENTFVGRSAGMGNTAGTMNTFVGELSGFNNDIGQRNTFLGTKSGMKNTFGSKNTFLGHRSGEENTGGYSNTFIGFRSGDANTTGFENTFGGEAAGTNNTTGFENTGFGKLAGRDNTTGSKNTYLGGWAGLSNTRGNGNTYLGFLSNGLPDNENATTVGYGAVAHGSYSTALGNRAFVHGPHRLVLGATEGYNHSEVGTFVGIGRVTPNYLLHLGKDDAAKPGTNVWTIASDRRLKKDVVPFHDGLNIIQQIDPVRFRYNGKAEMPTDKEYVGIIAQDIQQVAPYMVGEFVHEDTLGTQETYLDYNGNAMTYLMINSIKELNSSVEELYIMREELLAEINHLKTIIDSLAYIHAPANSSPSGSQNRSIMQPDPQDQARLWQNIPNPADGLTKIAYHVPARFQQARIQVSTLQGVIVRDYQIQQSGRGEIKIQLNELPAGIYTYQLIIDGQSADSKRMVLR